MIGQWSLHGLSFLLFRSKKKQISSRKGYQNDHVDFKKKSHDSIIEAKRQLLTHISSTDQHSTHLCTFYYLLHNKQFNINPFVIFLGKTLNEEKAVYAKISDDHSTLLLYRFME